MEHLAILQKINDNIYDTLEPRTSIYIFAAAIYDTWNNGVELEKNLANRLVEVWQEYLNETIDMKYAETKYLNNRPTYELFCKQTIEQLFIDYKDNNGIKKALKAIWIEKYGNRFEWPN